MKKKSDIKTAFFTGKKKHIRVKSDEKGSSRENFPRFQMERFIHLIYKE